MLKHAYEAEDVVIVKYKGYVHRLTDETDFSEDTKKKIKNYMTILVAQSINHARIFNEQRMKVSRSNKNEF